MARPLTDTDIFKFFDTGSGISNRMKTILKNPAMSTVLNTALESTLVRFGQTFKEPIALKTLAAIRNNEMILFMAKPEVNLPECIPFFRYSTDGKTGKIAVNLTNIVTVSSNQDEGEDGYVVEDMRKLYAILVSSYINLKLPDPKDYPIKALEHGARIWAKMFCKILNTTIGLSTSRDRYAAYFYYAIRFFLTYFIGAPAGTIDAISATAIPGGIKNPLMITIEEYFENHPGTEQEFYGSFTGFCTVLFNNEITNVKGLRMANANPNEKLNVSFYIKRFIDSYYQSSIMSLASVHYFTWMVVCTQKKAFMVNIKMLASIFDGNEAERYIAALYNELT